MYEEKELLKLQQILFFRELGFELEKIKSILQRSDFDQLSALHSHRKVLKDQIKRTETLITTIDKTIKHLKGKVTMKDHELYYGFDSKRQKEYEKQLLERCGDKVKPHFEECEHNVKNWTTSDWDDTKKEAESFCKELATLLENKTDVKSGEVQRQVRRHYTNLKKFWTPDRESYLGHAELILTSELRKYYEAFHPKLPEYLAEGMKVFAARELS